ncbi:MAG: pyruvate, phosphate dikinase, partial [Gemmatimonadales bacterium]
MSDRLVYFFSQGRADGTAAMKDILGGKGAGLAEMTNLRIPVPPGFTIPASLCSTYLETRSFPPRLKPQVETALQRLEAATGKVFGDADNPLLVSVRSGAALSMPGMMETILNLGLNNTTVEGLGRMSGNAGFAYDSYRRFVQMFGGVVFDVPKRKFEELLARAKRQARAERDIDLPVEALQALVAEYQALIKRESGKTFPENPEDQLWGAIAAVFESWNTQRARDYRKLHDIPDRLGTAVNVVAMVFGNLGEDSGTGVAFTRDPSTGEKTLYGEYLLNAQGEDVVSGARTPEPIAKLTERLPEAYAELERVARTLERHFRDVQDLEFTIERGKLYMLQTRSAKRTARAAVRIAVEMVREGIIDRKEAVKRVEPVHVDQLLLPRFDEKAVEKARKEGRYLGKGLNASPGAATGRAGFEAARAGELRGQGQPVLLVRPETSPDDFHGMVAAAGILTSRGGSTSHAAVVARGLGLPCVVGMGELSVDIAKRTMQVGGKTLKEGGMISIDGTTGEVFLGELPTIAADYDKEKDLHQILAWADQIRTLGVWVNADPPDECRRARRFGAEGVGLARTEHMFR